MPQNKIIKFIRGSTVVGYARTRNNFVAVSSEGKRQLEKLFLREVSESDVADELAQLIEEGSITIKF